MAERWKCNRCGNYYCAKCGQYTYGDSYWWCPRCTRRGRYHPETTRDDGECAHTLAAGCFPGDTLVLTPEGYQRIDTLVRGAAVLSWQPDARQLVRREVTRVLEHPPERIWTLAFASERRPLRATRWHALLLERGWVRMGDIVAGDRLVDVTGPNHEVARCVPGADRLPVHNLFTTSEHNFVVEGVVAHNFAFFRRSRTLLHRLLVDPAPERRIGTFPRVA